MNITSHQKKKQHLYLRSGFGESISAINKSGNKSTDEITEEIFINSRSSTPLFLNTESDSVQINKKNKKKMMKEERVYIRDLNLQWINKMSNDKAQLTEKMTLFWHGHFACKNKVGLICQNQNNAIRKNALGKFGDMLFEISKDPGMLQFLNNQQNRKRSPNENFAREVMELFTMGRGNYSEKDIKEGARAFTGWGFNKNGQYVFRKNLHDFGEKTFFYKTGNYTGEDILSMILENRKTSEYITQKIYKYFVNENVDEEKVKELSKKFYESEYDISKLMKSIFKSDWFYDKENIGAKIKSPVELLAGLIRTFNIKFNNELSLLALQKAMGQILFNPPNVAGWAGGRSWIDTSSLMYRLKLPELIFKSSEISFDFKDDTKEMSDGKFSKKEKKQYTQLKAQTDLKQYVSEFSKYKKEELIDELSEYLLQTDLSKETKQIINRYADNSNTENLIESLTLRIISAPEYQMC